VDWRSPCIRVNPSKPGMSGRCQSKISEKNYIRSTFHPAGQRHVHHLYVFCDLKGLGEVQTSNARPTVTNLPKQRFHKSNSKQNLLATKRAKFRFLPKFHHYDGWRILLCIMFENLYSKPGVRWSGDSNYAKFMA
jgi:hypothetical protein